jgi:hypothetical protein
VLAELADLVARGEVEVPIAGVFALDDVRDAYPAFPKNPPVFSEFNVEVPFRRKARVSGSRLRY